MAQDPAQLLLNLMKAGQEAWLQAARATTAQTGTAQSGTAQAGTARPPTAPHGDPLADFATMTAQFMQLQQSYLAQVNSAWLNFLGLATPGGAGTAEPDDRRFAGDPWSNDPRFDALRRTYLAYSSGLHALAETAPVDEKTKGALRYTVRQFTDAMSPANFLATNPEALQLAQESGGRSLAEGLSLFFHDLALGRVSMTDEEAFEVGRNVATMDGAVVFENDLIQLIQYRPRTGQVHERPLLLVPPCINKYYILDLQPENSFVRHALDHGHSVFLVSWRNVTHATSRFTWDDYIQLGVLQALDTTLAISGADRANALGFCVGGTLLASALAVAAARGERRVSSMTLLTTLLDFADTGEIGNLVSEATTVAREQTIGKGGVMPGKELGFVFSSLRANDLIWQYVVNSYLKGRKPPAFDLLYWNSDGTNLPGPMFCWYLRNTYLENKLREPGGTRQCGVPVDLAAIRVPTYLYASRDDHIVPWKTAFESSGILGGDTTFVLGASGHIAGVVNPPERKRRNHWVTRAEQPEPPPGASMGTGRTAEPANADEWLARAQSEPGSWWPHWSAWLARHAGALRKAASALGSEAHSPIESAPGRYVRERIR